MKYQFTDKMREISGFGGGYEEACRQMVVAGLEWLDNNPDANPEFSGYEGIYGVIRRNNEDAKQLSNAVTSAVEDCTGAMHQAAIGHCLRIRNVGWDKYVEEMKVPNQMSKLKNFYTTGPADFKPGDVFACVVALHYVRNYEDGTPEYRMYRCAFPDPQLSDGIPQGQNIGLNEEIMQRLFPTAISVRELAKK